MAGHCGTTKDAEFTMEHYKSFLELVAKLIRLHELAFQALFSGNVDGVYDVATFVLVVEATVYNDELIKEMVVLAIYDFVQFVFINSRKQVVCH